MKNWTKLNFKQKSIEKLSQHITWESVLNNRSETWETNYNQSRKIIIIYIHCWNLNTPLMLPLLKGNNIAANILRIIYV